MQYLENLGKQEKFIIKWVVDTWFDDIKDSLYISHDNYGIPLYELIDEICKADENQLRIEELSYRIDPESGEVHIYQFYDCSIVKKLFGEHYKECIKNLAEKRKHSIIMALSFVHRLFQEGLIYFSEESFEESTFDEWAVPLQKYPSPQYLYELGYFVSRDLGSFLDRFLASPIIPSCYLIDLYRNAYKTPEQLRFKQQQKNTELALEEAKKANKLAKRANHISLGIAIGTVIITGIITWLCATFVPISIHKSFTEQLNYRLDKIHRTDSIQSKTIQDIDIAIDSIQSSVNRLQIKKNIKQDNNEQVENAKP